MGQCSKGMCGNGAVFLRSVWQWGSVLKVSVAMGQCYNGLCGNGALGSILKKCEAMGRCSKGIMKEHCSKGLSGLRQVP